MNFWQITTFLTFMTAISLPILVLVLAVMTGLGWRAPAVIPLASWFADLAETVGLTAAATVLLAASAGLARLLFALQQRLVRHAEERARQRHVQTFRELEMVYGTAKAREWLIWKTGRPSL